MSHCSAFRVPGRRGVLAVVSLVCLLCLGPLASAAGERPPTSEIRLLGPGSEVLVGQEFTVEIELESVDVYGVELVLSFDPAKLEVLDDDGIAPGVQILPGLCPSPDSIVENLADNGTGVIGYAVSAQAPCSVGLVATIRFLALQQGTTPVDFTESILYDSGAHMIAVLPFGTTIVISASPVDEMSWSTIKALYE